MPAKSPTDLTTDLGILTERNDNTRREVEVIGKAVEGCKDAIVAVRSDLTREIHDRQTGVEHSIAGIRQEVALLRQRMDDHVKRVETWDNRRWGLILLMAGALLSLASGLIVALARK